MAIDRGPWNALVDDDGSNLVGTIWNKDKIKTVILDPVEAAIPIVPAIPPPPAWVSVPFAAGNFTSGAGGTWTVAAGQVLDQKYLIDGEAIDLLITISGATISGGGSGNITIAGWPVNLASTPSVLCFSSLSATGWGPVMAAGNGPTLNFNRTDFASWPVSAGGMYLYLSSRFRIL